MIAFFHRRECVWHQQNAGRLLFITKIQSDIVEKKIDNEHRVIILRCSILKHVGKFQVMNLPVGQQSNIQTDKQEW